MDADGFFTVKRNTYGVRVLKDCGNPTYCERVGIKQVQKEAIELIYKHFGGCFRIEKPSAKNGKPLFCVHLSNQKAHKFIKAIIPYLRIKKVQATLLLELRKSIDAPRRGCRKIVRLNRWGFKSEFKQSFVDDETIRFRECILTKIKSLNDSRHDIKHQPIPWR